jgi:hypothetical protein
VRSKEAGTIGSFRERASRPRCKPWTITIIRHSSALNNKGLKCKTCTRIAKIFNSLPLPQLYAAQIKEKRREKFSGTNILSQIDIDMLQMSMFIS